MRLNQWKREVVSQEDEKSDFEFLFFIFSFALHLLVF